MKSTGLRKKGKRRKGRAFAVSRLSFQKVLLRGSGSSTSSGKEKGGRSRTKEIRDRHKFPKVPCRIAATPGREQVRRPGAVPSPRRPLSPPPVRRTDQNEGWSKDDGEGRKEWRRRKGALASSWRALPEPGTGNAA